MLKFMGIYEEYFDAYMLPCILSYIMY